MSKEHVTGTKQGHVYYVTLNRPEKRNALSFEMLVTISGLIEEQVFDSDIRVIVIKGEGPAYSSGADFESLAMLVGRFMKDSAAGGASIRADINQYQQYLNRLEAIEIPIICAMHGHALGMSLELALACDIRLMSSDCVWGMMELKFGAIADLGGTSRLARTVGPSRAMEVFMTGRKYSAEQALNWGLISYVYPPDGLFAEADKLAGEIAQMAPVAVGAVKKIVKKGEGVDLMTQLDMEVNLQSILVRTEDFQEGIKAMIEKRTPIWQRK